MIPDKTKRTRRAPVRESTIIQAILNALVGRTDIRIWRQNTGAARRKSGALVRFGVPGQADLSGILDGGRRLEIEVKTAIGRQSDQQQAFAAMIREYGGVYILARSPEDVLQVLDQEIRP